MAHMGARGRRMCCIGAFALAMTSMWALDVICVQFLDAASRLLRTGAALTGCAVCLGLLVLAQRRPQSFAPKVCAVIGMTAATVGSWLLFADFGPSTSAMRVAGFTASCAASTWAIAQAGAAMAVAPDTARGRMLCAGYAAGCVASCALAALCVYAPATLPFAIAIPQAASIALSWPSARPEIERFSSSEAALDLAVTHPRSFLPFTNLLFVAIILFACAGGFAYAGTGTAATNGSLLTYQLATLPVELAAAALGLSRSFIRESDGVEVAGDKNAVGTASDRERRRYAPHLTADGLYHFAAGLLAVGFCLGPFLGSARQGENAVSLWALVGANGLFLLFMYHALIELAARNPRAAVPVAAFAGVALNAGLFVDSLLWLALEWFIAIPTTDSDLGSIVASAFFIVFFVFCTAALHRFSFDEAVTSVEPVREPNANPTETEAFEARCSSVAEEFRLTPRETEIFRLLAAGRNCQSVQERLGLTRNTVKAHTRSIYAKLGVHSQQQLIDIVEQ